MPLLISATPGGNNSGGGGGPPFTFTQTVATSLWIVNHNLGYYPDVRVYNLLNQLVGCDVEQVSLNQTRLSFNDPFAGFANLI